MEQHQHHIVGTSQLVMPNLHHTPAKTQQPSIPGYDQRPDLRDDIVVKPDTVEKLLLDMPDQPPPPGTGQTLNPTATPYNYPPFFPAGNNTRDDSHEIKLPPFWHKDPRMWFNQVESKFQQRNVRSEDTKYHAIVSSLDGNVAQHVSDILENPPQEGKYEYLKEKLIQRLSESTNKQVNKLLSDLQLGDQKPSQLLREMKRLANNTLSDEFLKTLWLRRLPSVIQGILSVSENPDLTTLSQVADNLIETTMMSNSNTVLATNFSTTAREDSPNSNSLERRVNNLECLLSEFIAESRASIKEIKNLCRRNRGRSQSNSRKFNHENNSRFTAGNNNNSAGNRSDVDKFCIYHSKYGIKAHRCCPPCDWVDSRSGNA